MTEIDGIYAIFLLISIVITLYLYFYGRDKRPNPDTFYFSFLLLAVSIGTIKNSFEMVFSYNDVGFIKDYNMKVVIRWV